jgi:hypothetical protein
MVGVMGHIPARIRIVEERRSNPRLAEAKKAIESCHVMSSK